MRTLLLSCTTDTIIKAQCEPFSYLKKELQRELGMTVKHIQLEDSTQMEAAYRENEADMVFLLPLWRETPEQLEKVVKALRSHDPKRKLIFVDPFAQTTSYYFNLLPHVDWFLKRQRLENSDEYQQNFMGGFQSLEFMAKTFDLDLNGWDVSSDVPEGYENCITAGWSLGTAVRFYKQLKRPWFSFKSKPKKEVDLFCRLSLGSKKKQEWYCYYRKAAVEAVKPLEADYRVAASALYIEDGLIPKRQYKRELQGSRIVFSPFGWGEGCWRDFEAVCNESLLIKPSMAHIETHPNIFIDGETYVSVAWDFSDFEEKCRYYLEHPDEANRIIENASRVYKDYFEKGAFIQLMRKLWTESPKGLSKAG